MNLQRLDELYRNATDASAGITFTDGDGIIIHVNDAICKMTGYSKEDFLGKKHEDVLKRLDESIDDERLAKHFYHNPQWRGEIVMLDKSGNEIWTDTTILPVLDQHNGLEGLFTLSLDITDKKRIERELGNNQQKLGFVLDSLQTAFWEWDMRSNTAWFNDNWPRMLGYQPSEVPKDARAWADFVHPEDRERTIEEVNFHVRQRSLALVCLQRFRHKNGKWVHVMTKGRVVERDEDGKAIRFIGVNHDISAISRLEDFSLHIQDLAGLGIWDMDLKTGEIHWSRKVYEIFGVDLKTRPYDVARSIDMFDTRHKKILDEAFSNLITKEIPYDLEILLASGRWVRVAGRVESYEGKPYRAFGIIQDINERKHAEEILKKSQETQNMAIEEAQKASRMKSQFMATVSHEIRTPMSGVIGMTELLSETELTAEQREIVQTIKTCGENLLNLVNDILDYSKLEADKVHLDKRPFKLSDTVKNTLDLFQYKARQKDIKLIANIDSSVQHFILQDEARLYQVLFNLVGNAVKFTKKGEISLTAKRSSNDRLRIDITDTGIGIPEDKLDTIFESFTQLTPGHQVDSVGTGLGLAISRSLVQLMGGDIKVRSTVNQGSCFSFEIEAPSVEITGEEQSKTSTSSKVVSDLSNLRTLIVEDNPINQKLLLSILERHNVQVDLAENGDIAYQKTRDNEYHLIFMDVQMPVLDGLEATKKIRNDVQIKRQPIIIALTANVTPEHQEECLKAGMNDFLPKPIRLQTIRSLLQFYANKIGTDSHHQIPEIKRDETSKGPILNREKLFREFSGFEDLLAQFSNIFLDNYTSYLQQIETELANDELDKVAKTAHTYKGIVANFQSIPITKNLELLEELARANKLSATKDCFRDTTSLTSLLVEEIQSLRAQFKQ